MKSARHSSFRLTVLSTLVISAGVVAVARAAAEQALSAEYAWLAMVALAIFVGPMTSTVYIPGMKARLALGDMVTFACAALFGPNAAILAAVAEGSITSLKLTNNLLKFSYNIAMFAVSMAGASFATQAAFPLFGVNPGRMPVGEMVAALGLFTATYLVIATLLVTAYVSFSNREPFWKFWRDNCLWMSLSYAASGVSALAVWLLVERFGYYTFLVPVGFIMLVFLFYRTYFRKVESANKRTEQVEEQLRQSQKMEAVGRLAGGVAHDFNNLLTAILGYSEILIASLDERDPLCKHVEEIKKASDRAASLTRQLLAFSRKQVLQPKVINLNLVVADMEKMLGRLIGEDINLVTYPDPNLGRIKADPGQIEQVIMNLAVNARDAMSGGGRISIETANITLDAPHTDGHINLQSGPYVMLAVTDTGCGMDRETQSLIFEPFFTTKEKGKGTGLGLSTVYGIVHQSGGDIVVESEPGRGATFKIFLPRVADAGEIIEQAEALAEVYPVSETILLVEDEEIVRNLLHDILRMKGYHVLEAANGIEALELCRRTSRTIDLMITDVVMPQMGGRELAERLAELRPETRVLYVSGYTEDEMVHHGVSQEKMNFLQKPFSPDALIQKVRHILDGSERNHSPRTIISDRQSSDFPDSADTSSDTIH
ncbi:MAG: response regulator [Blastocatellia bacterium]|nr:response regulator [Blastocatellia bacterium]